MSTTKYTGYKTPFPGGVKLPEIEIEKKRVFNSPAICNSHSY